MFVKLISRNLNLNFCPLISREFYICKVTIMSSVSGGEI